MRDQGDPEEAEYHRFFIWIGFAASCGEQGLIAMGDGEECRRSTASVARALR